MGYAQKNTLESGNQMLAAQFISTGASDGLVTLSDLTVSGYEAYDEETDEGGTSGDFSIQLLNPSGATESRYYWFDDDVKTGWFDPAGNASDAVKIEVARGVWTSGSGLVFTSAGTVNENDVLVITRNSGNQAVGNATPVDLKLSQIAVSGYEPYDEETDEGGTSGDLSIQFLSSSGTTLARYYWFDDDIKFGWFDTTGNDASNVSFLAGTGVWVSGGGLTIRIPAPEL